MDDWDRLCAAVDKHGRIVIELFKAADGEGCMVGFGRTLQVTVDVNETGVAGAMRHALDSLASLYELEKNDR